MGKTWAYKLFRVGRIPAQIKAQLDSEGVLLQEEGISGSTTYRNFHRPGAYSTWRRMWYSASLTITHTRVVGLAFSRPIINVPFTDRRLQRLDLSVEKGQILLIAFDAAMFHNDWSGTIEYRFRTRKHRRFGRCWQHGADGNVGRVFIQADYPKLDDSFNHLLWYPPVGDHHRERRLHPFYLLPPR
jgi:hypothetical protein